MKHDHLSDVGQVRQNNEDVAWSGVNKNNNFAGVVCDGLGGYKGGSTASGIMVDVFKQRFDDIDLSLYSKEQIVKWIEKTIHLAREKISQKILDNEQLKNMATTFVCCIVVNNRAYLFNVGDSRGWYISNEKSFQITEDQNLYNYLVKVKASPEYFAAHKDNLYAITQFVGAIKDKPVKPDVYELDIKPNSYIVLTSDGCHNFISLDDIIKNVTKTQDFNNICSSLIARALANGSNDNLSIVVMGF